ncbi:MAG: rRNA maturation RNase YbeY [Prevotellaceae bacterium]|jgi:rRNA maturation RNase YbeY|nr:rRNA maturation RNase YbeY [Prevotellaceae bacterium]
MITWHTDNITAPALKRRSLAAWITFVAQSYHKKVGEIACIFCSDEKILEINRRYLQHDYYTDIITFDYSMGDTVSGDLFISLDTVKTNAALFDVDFRQELYRVIIHGVLHLCGQNDKTRKDAALMRRKEDDALAQLAEYLPLP